MEKNYMARERPERSHPPCVWFQPSEGAWCRRASGTAGRTFVRGQAPSGSLGRDWRPWAPSQCNFGGETEQATESPQNISPYPQLCVITANTGFLKFILTHLGILPVISVGWTRLTDQLSMKKKKGTIISTQFLIIIYIKSKISCKAGKSDQLKS